MSSKKRILLHGIAVIALIAATLATWHWRFVAITDPLPPIHLTAPLTGWTTKSGNQSEVIIANSEPILRLERKSQKDKTPAVEVWFGALEQIRFIHIRCESRWQNIELGAQPWRLARFVVVMEDHNGCIKHPEESVIFHGSGSSPWKKDEVILELTDDMANSGLQIAMLGKTGLLEVRDLSVVAVRQRSWVSPVTVMIVIGWVLIAVSFMRSRSDDLNRCRAFAASGVIVAVSWIVVFPQTMGLLRSPIAGFSVNEPLQPSTSTATPELPLSNLINKPPAAKPPAAKPPVSKPPAAKPPAAKPPAAKPPAAKPPAAAKNVLPPSERQSGSTYTFIRKFDKNFLLLHLVFYAGFTFSILLITGEVRQWTLPAAVALLSEIVPAFVSQDGGWDDAIDISQNITGVALAVALWIFLRHKFSKRLIHAPDKPT